MIPIQRTALVVDASVAVKWVFPEVGSEGARRILLGYQQGIHRLLAPDIFVAEVVNVAWKKCCLKGEITEEEARLGVSSIVSTAPGLIPSSELWSRALSIAHIHRRPVYDCLYVALAVYERCDLITADSRLVATLNPVFGCIRLLE